MKYCFLFAEAVRSLGRLHPFKEKKTAQMSGLYIWFITLSVAGLIAVFQGYGSVKYEVISSEVLVVCAEVSES